MDFSNSYDFKFQMRHLLQEETDNFVPALKECNADIYSRCFSKCPPIIPGPPPPPNPSLQQFRQPWCKGHDNPWTCMDTSEGPRVNGTAIETNPKIPVVQEGDNTTLIASTVSSLVVLLAIAAVVVGLFLYRRRRALVKKQALSNAYTVGYMSNQSNHPWSEGDGSTTVGDDGSEIFYQVDRTALANGNSAISNGGRSVPDVVHNATISRSASSSSKTPLISSPGSNHYHTAGRPPRLSRFSSSGAGPELDDIDGHSTIGSMAHFGHYGVAFANARRNSAASPDTVRPRYGGPTYFNASAGYSTYSPANSSKGSHPSLYKQNSAGNRTPRAQRQRSFGSADNRPRPLRKQSSASNIQRSDSLTLSSRPGKQSAQTYKDNWNNFDEVTATMKRARGGRDKGLVLNTDSFIESSPSDFVEPEEATSVDQLGLPNRNPFLQGFYDDTPQHVDYERAFEDMGQGDYINQSDLSSPEDLGFHDQYDNSPTMYKERIRNRSAPQGTIQIVENGARSRNRPRHASDSAYSDFTPAENPTTQRNMDVARDYVDLAEDSDTSVEV